MQRSPAGVLTACDKNTVPGIFVGLQVLRVQNRHTQNVGPACLVALGAEQAIPGLQERVTKFVNFVTRSKLHLLLCHKSFLRKHFVDTRGTALHQSLATRGTMQDTALHQSFAARGTMQDTAPLDPGSVKKLALQSTKYVLS